MKKIFSFLAISCLFLSLHAMDTEYPLPLILKQPGKEFINSIAWSKDERYLAVASEGESTCRIWDMAIQKMTKTLKAHAAITTIAWGPGPFLALGLKDGRIEIWNVDVASLCFVLQGDARIGLLSWSHDGKYVASLAKDFVPTSYPYVNPSTITIWDVGAKICKVSLPFENHITALQWSPFDYYLAVGIHDVDKNEDQLSILDLEQVLVNPQLLPVKLLTCLAQKEIYSLEWSPVKGDRLAISLQDGTIAIYAPVFNFKEQKYHWCCTKRWVSTDLKCIVSHINWSADGRYILSGGIDKIDVWDSHTGQIDNAKGASLEGLTALASRFLNDLRALQAFLNNFRAFQELGEPIPEEEALEEQLPEEQVLFPQLLAHAPHSSLIATALRQQFEGAFPHILLIFNVHTWYSKWYLNLKTLMMREIGKSYRKPFRE